MAYTFRGQLCGYICPEIEEPIADATVRLYRVGEVSHVTERATAAAKETFEILDAGAVEAKADRVLVETQTDDEGRFEVELGDQHDYDGEAFEIDVRTDQVPGPQDDDVDPVQFHVTTHQPKWRQSEEGAISSWEYCVSNRWWCRLRERFGAWVICGRVMVCETVENEEVPTGPAVGYEVSAYDTDIVQRDELGTGTTDANGHFRIYYTRSDFERTPAPWLPVELIGGPDVHVEIRDPGGTRVLVEDRSRGRQSDRENVGPCFHIGEFCVDEPEDGNGQPPVVEPMWTHVGRYDIRTQISAAGYAQEGSDDLAFTGTLPLIGALPYGALGAPHEYRFRIAEYPGGGTTGPYTDLDASMIAPTRIGMLQYWDETAPGTWDLQHEPYWLNKPTATNNVDVDTDGWIQVPRESDKGTPGVRSGSGLFVRNSDRLARFRSQELLHEVFDLTTSPEHVAGESLDASERSSEHVYELVFETREIDPSTGAPVSGSLRRDVLSKIVLSNTTYEQHRHPSWNGNTKRKPGVVMLDIKEFRTSSDGCQRLDDTMDVMISAYHPHINGASLRLVGGSGSLPSPPSITPGADDEVAATKTFDISSLQPCAYNLWLDVSYDLTSGHGRVDGDHDYIGFCVGEESDTE